MKSKFLFCSTLVFDENQVTLRNNLLAYLPENNVLTIENNNSLRLCSVNVPKTRVR